MESCSALLALCTGNSPVPNSPHKGEWRGALMFSLICAWISDWVNNRETDDSRRHRGHYDVNVMDLANFPNHFISSSHVRGASRQQCCGALVVFRHMIAVNKSSWHILHLNRLFHGLCSIIDALRTYGGTIWVPNSGFHGKYMVGAFHLGSIIKIFPGKGRDKQITKM